MLWTLLVAIGSGTIAWASVVTAHRAGGGVARYAIAIPVAVVLAFLNWLAWMKISDVVDRHIAGYPEPRQNRLLLPVYVAVWLSSFGGAAVAYWLVSALSR